MSSIGCEDTLPYIHARTQALGKIKDTPLLLRLNNNPHLLPRKANRGAALKNLSFLLGFDNFVFAAVLVGLLLGEFGVEVFAFVGWHYAREFKGLRFVVELPINLTCHAVSVPSGGA